jgi:hypothetical protein
MPSPHTFHALDLQASSPTETRNIGLATLGNHAKMYHYYIHDVVCVQYIVYLKMFNILANSIFDILSTGEELLKCEINL